MKLKWNGLWIIGAVVAMILFAPQLQSFLDADNSFLYFKNGNPQSFFISVDNHLPGDSFFDARIVLSDETDVYQFPTRWVNSKYGGVYDYSTSRCLVNGQVTSNVDQCCAWSGYENDDVRLSCGITLSGGTATGCSTSLACYTRQVQGVTLTGLVVGGQNVGYSYDGSHYVSNDISSILNEVCVWDGEGSQQVCSDVLVEVSSSTTGKSTVSLLWNTTDPSDVDVVINESATPGDDVSVSNTLLTRIWQFLKDFFIWVGGLVS